MECINCKIEIEFWNESDYEELCSNCVNEGWFIDEDNAEEVTFELEDDESEG